MPDAAVTVERRGEVCLLTLERPTKHNALSTALENELALALERCAARGSRCILIRGAGRSFSAGADVTEFGDRDPEAILDYYERSGAVYERLAGCPQPTIAAIHGHCLGAGLELALAADFRVADMESTFGMPEVGLGILPSSGGTVRLVRLAGTARAKELVLLRERFTAADALAWGLVTEVAPTGGSLERALALADRLAELPPTATAVAKTVIDRVEDGSRDAALALERLAYATLSQTADARMAALEFGEDRHPA